MKKIERISLVALAVFAGLVINIEFFHESIIKFMKHLLSTLLVAVVLSSCGYAKKLDKNMKHNSEAKSQQRAAHRIARH